MVYYLLFTLAESAKILPCLIGLLALQYTVSALYIALRCASPPWVVFQGRAAPFITARSKSILRSLVKLFGP